MALIIKNCDYFIGLDSGFSHIASCFNKYSILLWGEFPKKLWNRKIYSGNYGKLINCTKIIVQNGTTKYLPEKLVYKVFKGIALSNLSNKYKNTQILYKINFFQKIFISFTKELKRFFSKIR